MNKSQIRDLIRKAELILSYAEYKDPTDEILRGYASDLISVLDDMFDKAED